MTALLKKRALAEYTTQVVQEPPSRIVKKVKLIEKPSLFDYVASFRNCKTSNEALQLLIRISDLLTERMDYCDVVVKKLSNYFNQQTESVVRAKILSLFSIIGQSNHVDDKGVLLVLESTMKLVIKDTSHKVIAQGLKTMNALVSRLPPEHPMTKKLYGVAKQYLMDTNHSVKSICLTIIAYLNVSDDNASLISEYIHSQDARVRCTAFNMLVYLIDQGRPINISLYADACQAVNDDYEIVREAALKVVAMIANNNPDCLVKVGDEDILIIDDAFGKVCHAINDVSMHVRVCAAKLLGTMLKVSSRFLNQTLDKKLMSNMRRKQSLHERNNEILTSGEWSRGRKWADDKPKELLDKRSVSVLSSGACGAFVHGLEDEFMEVRSASIDAMCALAQRQPNFAMLSLDFLVDMFNDEIEMVRIKAIDCLTTISTCIVLREHQLETILGALEDQSIDVREGLHRMLAACQMSNKDCLQMVINSLLENLKKYRQDKKSTWWCMKEMGIRHSDLALPIVPKLLNIHPFFELPEPDVEDPLYISVLILVFNAANHCVTMSQLFEEHTRKHYSYLRVSLPDLVPALELEGVCERETEKWVPSREEGAEFLLSLVRRVSGDATSRTQLAASILPQLDRVAETDAALASAARFAAALLQAQLLISAVLSNSTWCSAATTTAQGNAVRNNITQILTLILKLEYLFVGVSGNELAMVKQLKLKALVLHLLYIVRVSNLSALALCDYFLSQVYEIELCLIRCKWEKDEFCSGIFDAMAKLDDNKPGAVARSLLPVLQKTSLIVTPTPSLAMRMCRAVVNGPVSSAESPIKFTAGLVIATTMDADIFGLSDPSALRIKIHYPDQQTHFAVPRLQDLRPVRDQEDSDAYRLLTKALISHTVWTEACYVELSLCLELPEGELTQRAHYSVDPHLDLCQPVKLYIAPKPVRRGV